MARSSVVAAYLALTIAAAACRSSDHGSQAQEAVSPPAPAATPVASPADRRAEVLRFRSLFRKLAVGQGMTDADIRKMVLLPSDTFLTPPPAAMAAVSADEVNAALLAQAKGPGETPSAFYQNSMAAPFDDGVDPEAVFTRNGPATIVFIPGIFGEFIDKNVIHELYTAPSSFTKAYQDKLNQVEERGYSLAALGSVSFKLGERVRVGGIDGKDGLPHVQALFMQAAFGSMESLGDNGANAEIFLNRLNKVFSQIPLDACRNIYIVGYSQGTAVVLDMMAKAYANPAQYPFLQNVKGAVTMTGVIYGTEAADDAYFNSGSANYKMTQQIKAVLDQLEVAKDGDNFITTSGKLIKDWAAILSVASQSMSAPPPVDPGLAQEQLAGAATDSAQTIEQLRHVFSDLFRPGLMPAARLANIQRGKILLNAVLQGTKGLATKSRIEWWATHTLPATLPVYSIAASMPDSTTPSSASPLLDSPSYGADTYDYQKVLRPAFYSMVKVSGVQLNDSQVLSQKEMIFPELISKWNPQQPVFPTHFLGVMGTHHWGVAFPNALDTAGGATNPFPRRVFAEALGAFLLEPRG